MTGKKNQFPFAVTGSKLRGRQSWNPTPLDLFLYATLFRNAAFHIPVFFPLLLYRGFEIETILLVESFYFFSRVLLDVPLGVLSDRIGGSAAITSSAGLMVFGLFCTFIASHFILLAIARILIAISISIYSSSRTTALMEVTANSSEINLEKVFQRENSVQLLAVALTSFAGGYLGAAFGLHSPWVLSIMFLGTSFVMFLTVNRLMRGRCCDTQHKKQWPTRSALSEIVVAIPSLILFGTVFGVCKSFILIIQPSLATLGFGLAMSGIAYFCIYILSAVFSIVLSERLAAKTRRSSTIYLFWGITIFLATGWAISLALPSVVGTFLFCICMCALGMLLGTHRVFLISIIYGQLNRRAISSAMSVYTFFANCFAGILTLLGSQVVEHSNLSNALLIQTILVAFWISLVLHFCMRARK